MLNKDYLKKYIIDTTELADEDTFRRLYDYLPDFRKEKIDRLKSEEARRESLGAFSLLARGISEVMMKDEQPDWPSLGYATGTDGKPFFTNRPDIHFSMSHTRGRAMCVIAGSEVGCDVERIRAVSEAEIKRIHGITHRFFHPTETAFLDGIEKKEVYVEEFYKIWTMKEAFIKYTGRGMGQDMRSFLVLEKSSKVCFTTEIVDGYAHCICTEA